jgi:hypothetical protein
LAQHLAESPAIEWPEVDVVVVGEILRVTPGVPHGWADRPGDIRGEAIGGFFGDLDDGDLANAESPQSFGAHTVRQRSCQDPPINMPTSQPAV